MPSLSINQCKCPCCEQSAKHPDKTLHYQVNLLLSHLDEQHRRWVAAILSRLFGWGGIELVSRIAGLSSRTIRRGRDELDSDLRGCLVDRARRHGGGRPRRLTDDQVKRLTVILAEGAIASGWLNDLWTLRRVRQVVRRQLGETISIPALRRALKEQLGWTLQKPVQQLRDHDEEEVERWKKKEFSRIKREACLRHAYLAFIDESGFMLAPTVRRTYAPRGHTPVQTVTDPHAKISVIAAIVVSPDYRNARLVYQLSSDYANFNGKGVSTFLRLLQDVVKHRITVIWDSVRIHYAEPVKDLITGRNTLVLERFPANASGLNPVDCVWSYVKYGRLPNYAPFDLRELRRTLTAELRRLKKRPDLLFSFIRRAGLTLAGS